MVGKAVALVMRLDKITGNVTVKQNLHERLGAVPWRWRIYANSLRMSSGFRSNIVHLGPSTSPPPDENRWIVLNQVRYCNSEQSPDFHRGLVEMHLGQQRYLR